MGARTLSLRVCFCNGKGSARQAKGLFTAISASDTRGTPGTLELDELFGFLDSLQDSRSMKKKLASIRACLKDKGITDTNQEIPKETALPILESILQQQMQEKKLQSYYHLSPGNDITDEHDRNAAGPWVPTYMNPHLARAPCYPSAGPIEHCSGPKDRIPKCGKSRW